MESDKIKKDFPTYMYMYHGFDILLQYMFWLFQIFDSFWLHKNTKPFFLLKFEMTFLPDTLHTKNIYPE